MKELHQLNSTLDDHDLLLSSSDLDYYIQKNNIQLMNEEAYQKISNQAKSEELEQTFRLNPFIEKIYYTETEKIVAYEFITIKPLGKSPNGLLISSAIAVGLESGQVKVYDLFGNLLMDFHVGNPESRKQIVQIAASPLQDDMFISVLTKDNQFYIYDVILERKFQYQKDKYQELSEKARQNKSDNETQNNEDQKHPHQRHLIDESQPSQDSFDSIAQFDDSKVSSKNKKKQKKQPPSDDTAKYKSLLKIYSYRTNEPTIINMDQLLVSHGYPQYVEPNNGFKEFLIYVSKGEKFFIFADSQGYFTILMRDGGFRSRFFSGSKLINNMAKHSVNVIYSNERRVGYIKFLDSSAGGVMCDAGLNRQIIGAYLDQTFSGIIYAGTKTGEILVFESHSVVHKIDAIECKIIGKLQTNLQQEMIRTNKTIPYDFRAVKGSIILFSQDGVYEQINTTDIYSLIAAHNQRGILPLRYQPRFQGDLDIDFSSATKLAETKITYANALAIRSPKNPNQLILYECLAPQVKHDSMFENFNFKFPMFIVAFLLVIGYQIYKRKNNSYETEEESGLLGKFAKGKNLSAKAKNDLKEIEKMMGSLGDLSEGVKKLSGAPVNNRKR
ncbi:UNKNOWN [Stylonychia lemnae]|uniref:Uncharacterized protein n=1 Tax=Stylonychia lemnae TaxID=5949 RepID=A0A078AG01_STYLE|nr:UNKNOWN [Stylonychia lemnae]|eukprot:CDW81154.1 UNKNOWN [Stylonychia lemnae]